VNSKHAKTLDLIFSEPVAGNVEWRRIETLLTALGAQIIEGSGSRITVLLNGMRADFHRPHPGKEALRYRVKAVRELLEKAGVKR